jgi:HEAT repeat protein
MEVALDKRLLPLICWVIMAGGCAHPGPWFHQPTPDIVAGVVSPTQRIADLREIAKNADAKTPAEKDQIAAQLAGDIQKEPDPLIRAEIVRTLMKFPGAAADTIFRAAVNDSDNDVRAIACEAWGTRATPEAATVLATVLNGDVDHDVRMAAARGLGQTHEQVAIGALALALDDKDPAMQYRAVLSLQKVTGQDLGNDVNKWREFAKQNKLAPAQPDTSVAARLRNMF